MQKTSFGWKSLQNRRFTHGFSIIWDILGRKKHGFNLGTPRRFFKAYKYDVFKSIYLVFKAKNRYNFIKKYNLKFFFSCLFSVFWWQKPLKQFFSNHIEQTLSCWKLIKFGKIPLQNSVFDSMNPMKSSFLTNSEVQ